ncbi:hypothetical protein [Chloroflexus aggregans]|nr:hypothetical protein [Chloroflexus aggregans]
MKTMKAAVVHDFTQPLQIEEVPKPEPGFGEIVVKIEHQVFATPIFMQRTAIGR